MRYFYIFILTLILISCNEKKGYSWVKISSGEKISITDESECRKAIEKGKVLANWQVVHPKEMEKWMEYLRILYKGYVYTILSGHDFHRCDFKRKLHDK